MPYKTIKRVFDVLAASALLVLCLPILIPVALIIKLTSKGSVFFVHERSGLKGTTFSMYKYRTMVHNAHLHGPPITQEKDPRITFLGKILRKSKIDELPQLWNVIKGDMSLVGPRPQVPEYVNNLYPPIPRHIIMSVRPGITGRTQVWLRHEESLLAAQKDPVDFYENILLPKKVESDVIYVNNMSLFNDLKILGLTVLCCLSYTPRLEGFGDEQTVLPADDMAEAA